MGEFTPFLEILLKVGPYALFAYAEYIRRQQRDDHIEASKKRNEYLEKDIEAKNRLTGSIRALRLALYDQGRIKLLAEAEDDEH